MPLQANIPCSINRSHDVRRKSSYNFELSQLVRTSQFKPIRSTRWTIVNRGFHDHEQTMIPSIDPGGEKKDRQAIHRWSTRFNVYESSLFTLLLLLSYMEFFLWNMTSYRTLWDPLVPINLSWPPPRPNRLRSRHAIGRSWVRMTPLAICDFGGGMPNKPSL